MRRITLEVDDPAALRLRSEGDAAVGVYFDPAPLDPARSDPMSSDPGRNYTVRHHLVDGVRERIDLDVLVHGHGIGSTWADTTTVGAQVGLDHRAGTSPVSPTGNFGWPTCPGCPPRHASSNNRASERRSPRWSRFSTTTTWTIYPTVPASP
jgi:NADPH-dependent ferric siderophore reductase